MAKEIGLQAHKLNDEIVIDHLAGLDFLDRSGNPAYLTGGLAVQSYLAAEKYRSTVDLDFSMLWGGNFANFKEEVNPFVRALISRGYELPLFRKKGFTYEFSSTKGDQRLLVQHQRRSKKYFEKNEEFLERELENRRRIKKQGVSYPVMSPEDIIIHKLSRINVFKNKYGFKISGEGTVDELELESERKRSNLVEALPNVDASEIDEVRFLYDCLDVRRLAGSVGVNEDYFRYALKDWRARSTNNEIDFPLLLESLCS